MKRMILLAVIALCAFPVLAQAVQVEEVTFTQVGGAFATYDPAGGGTVTWSGGGSGIMVTDTSFYTYDEASVEATFTGVTYDVDPGGLASASFDSGIWELTLGGPADSDLIISGTLYGAYKYLETETGETTNKLDGCAIVVVNDADFSLGQFGPIFGDTIEWEGGIGSMAGLIADITLPMIETGFDLTSYAQAYTSTNNIVKLYADETVVPEPATLSLLAIGALSLIRRKKA